MRDDAEWPPNTATPEEHLGQWGERQACAVLKRYGAQTFRNADRYDPSDDLYIRVGDGNPLRLESGPLQVKTKTSSTYRRNPWVCKVKKRLGSPREEHGLEYWRFRKYVKRGVQALLFVEKRREVEPMKFQDSNQVLVCIPKECEGRVGAWKKDGRIVDFIFFDRGLMRFIGDTAFARDLLRFR